MLGFFTWWKEKNIILKLVLFIIPLTMALLWIIGSFTKLDRLVMFVVGMIVGGILINIFFAPQITSVIEWFANVFNAMFGTAEETAIIVSQIL